MKKTCCLFISQWPIRNFLLQGERVFFKHSFATSSIFFHNLSSLFFLTEHLPYDWRFGCFRQNQECLQGWIEADLFIDFHFIVCWLVPIKKKREHRSIGETECWLQRTIFFCHLWEFVRVSNSKLNSKNIERSLLFCISLIWRCIQCCDKLC